MSWRIKNRSRNIVFFVFILVILITLISAFVINKNGIKQASSPSEKFANEIVSDIKKGYGSSSNISVAMQRNLDVLNDSSSSDEEKYLALKNLRFYYSFEYSGSHKPETREFGMKTIGNFAKKNFPKFYHEGDFNIPCADPSCGEKYDEEGKLILEKIKSSGLPLYVKDTIIPNYEAAYFTPIENNDDKENKLFGMKLVYQQLTKYGDPVASQAAMDLKKYIKNKYDLDI